MPQITAPLLGSINNGVSLAYNTQFFATTSKYKRFTFEAPSTGPSEVYPRLDMIAGLREWVGARVVQSLSQQSFTIVNKWFEQTIAIDRANLEDDKYGLLTPAAQMLGENAARFPDIQIAGLMANGHTTLTYDGQNFFDSAHPTFTSAGAATTVANWVTGSSPAWFLIDSKRVIKPFIWQTRRPFSVIPKFSLTDPQVFWNKEFEWGVDGRCNAGYGMWQLAYMSQAPLTHDALVTARTSMASIRRPDGTPMGIMGDLLVVPSPLLATAKTLYLNEHQPFVTGDVVQKANTVMGMFEPLENEWLN